MRQGGLRLAAALALVCPGLASGAGAAERVFVPPGTFVKSWLYIEPSASSRTLTEGETWEVPVEYYLDPEEAPRGAFIRIYAGGPNVYHVDPRYGQKRGHQGGAGRRARVRPGKGRHVFRIEVPKPFEGPGMGNGFVTIVCQFTDEEGRYANWWTRRSGPWFRRRGGFFELETDRPGNLFLYHESVRVLVRLKDEARSAEPRRLAYRIHDVTRAVVAQGEETFVPRPGEVRPIELDLERRGTFLIEVEVPGWESRRITFARIPDVLAVTGGARTRFGMTNAVRPGTPERVEELCRVAQRLGLTTCRSMVWWADLEPGPGEFRMDAWEKALDLGNRYGIDTWLLLQVPPNWALKEGSRYRRLRQFNYSPFRCEPDAWRRVVTTAGRRFRGKLYGWEWLNEIVPGGTDDPVKDYLDLCRVGTEAARSVDPEVKILLAGGLWPRSFRLEMLNAGVHKYVDVLPVHYGDAATVLLARDDLASVGAATAVWDDETSRGLSTWGVPPLDALADSFQSGWLLDRWPDELVAGCENIIYFGGRWDPAGNRQYLMDDMSPRPVVATLAVLASKLFGAEPLGVFHLGKEGRFHLFDRRGEAVLLTGGPPSPSLRRAMPSVASAKEGGEARGRVSLNVGADRVVLTDYQGEEHVLPAPGSILQLDLQPPGFFLEGADLDVLKSYLVPTLAVRAPAGRPPWPVRQPRLTALSGKSADLIVHLRNPYDRPLSGSFRSEVDAAPGRADAAVVPTAPGRADAAVVPTAPGRADNVVDPTAPGRGHGIPFSLGPGGTTAWSGRSGPGGTTAWSGRRGPRAERTVPVPVEPGPGARPGEYQARVRVQFDRAGLPEVVKPFLLCVLSPEMLGNLLPNGDFESGDEKAAQPEGWIVQHAESPWVPAADLGLGLGRHAIRFENSPDRYGHAYRAEPVELAGGRTYLYTAWVWNQDMQAGSNISQTMKDGTRKQLSSPKVFRCGTHNAYWQMYAARYTAPADLKAASFCPVVKGSGWALYDNLRVTLFEDTDFAAEGHRARRKPKIDGDLDDWVLACPLPMIGRNQLTVLAGEYSWRPENLNAVGYFMWDDASLYAAFRVRDDVHHARRTGSAAVEDDSLILAFDPTNRGVDAGTRAFAYYVTDAPPGGGGGSHTIYRPQERSGGLQHGHLLRDSSVHEMEVRRRTGETVYEMCIPLSDLGGVQPGVGSKFAFSVQLNDNDGRGPAAHMSWGGGLSPAWRPEAFGVVTLVE